jgi:hypothetical protein
MTDEEIRNKEQQMQYMKGRRASEIMSNSHAHWCVWAKIIKDLIVTEKDFMLRKSKQCPEEGYLLSRFEYTIIEPKYWMTRHTCKGDEGFEDQGYDNEFKLLDTDPLNYALNKSLDCIKDFILTRNEDKIDEAIMLLASLKKTKAKMNFIMADEAE